MFMKNLWGVKPVYAVSCMLPCMMYNVKLSINVNMLELASIWVVCSPPAHDTQAYLFRTQLIRLSTSGWYYPSVPGGSRSLYHCVTGALQPIVTSELFRCQMFCTGLLQHSEDLYCSLLAIQNVAYKWHPWTEICDQQPFMPIKMRRGQMI